MIAEVFCGIESAVGIQRADLEPPPRLARRDPVETH